MEHEIRLKDEFIRLGQALKAAHLCMSGGEAKEMIAEGRVRVNDEVEVRRGRKLHDGDRVLCGEDVIVIRQAGHEN